MVVLGLLLLAASVGAAVSIAVSNTGSMSFHVFGKNVTSLSAGGLMLLGIALGVAALIGLWLMSAGMRHNRRRREADRHTVAQTRSRVDELEEENTRLRHAAERNAAAATTTRTLDDDPVEREPRAARDRDRDGDGIADRSEQGATPNADPPVSTAHVDGVSTKDSKEAPVVYPDDRANAGPAVSTPAFEATTRHQSNRVFGRRSK